MIYGTKNITIQSHLFVFLPSSPSWTVNVVPSTNVSEFRTQGIKFHIRFRCSRAFCMHSRLSNVESTMHWTILTGQSTSYWQKFISALLKLTTEHVVILKWRVEMKTCSCVDVDQKRHIFRYCQGFFWVFCCKTVWLVDTTILPRKRRLLH